MTLSKQSKNGQQFVEQKKINVPYALKKLLDKIIFSTHKFLCVTAGV